ncbi:MAG TPA: hypothetical protein VJR05_08100 [Acidimicrobiia bacterium]|nr:hypothetical protein [Acidimicrobiia bacterium]
MSYYQRGLTQALSGLRRGNQRSLYSGAALLVWAAWRRSKKRRLLYRRVLHRDEAVLIRAGRKDQPRVVVDDALADQVHRRRSDKPVAG